MSDYATGIVRLTAWAGPAAHQRGIGRADIGPGRFRRASERRHVGPRGRGPERHGRLDVVEAQGEVSDHESEKVYLGTLVLKPDTAPPVVHVAVVGRTLLARVHDNRTPNAPHDWRSVAARWDGGGGSMTWYGENLFQADLPAGAKSVEVCAVDAAGNQSCAKSQ